MDRAPEFYIGYAPAPPPGIRRRVRTTLALLATLVPGIAVLLVVGQRPFPAAGFEFLQFRSFEGVLTARPYPALHFSGDSMPWLLVGPGKMGIAAGAAPFDGMRVRLTGERIYRGSDRMLQVRPASIAAIAPAGQTPPLQDLGDVTLRGEIVDSKCYFGVMNPGSGKVHRDCAVRCISGGVPPALLVRDRRGAARTVLLASATGGPLREQILEFVAEPVEVPGRLWRDGERLILYADPRRMARVAYASDFFRILMSRRLIF